MYETIRLAAVHTAATALAYQEHGFRVSINRIDGMPAVQIPATASELTHQLAQLTGTVAEALAMQLADAEDYTPQRPFSEYFTAASYASGQSLSAHHGLGRRGIVDKLKARVWSQYSIIQALAEQILYSMADLQESEHTAPAAHPAAGNRPEVAA